MLRYMYSTLRVMFRILFLDSKWIENSKFYVINSAHFFTYRSFRKQRIAADQRLKYVLDLRTFVVDTQPDDGTLVPKHVGVGTWYEVGFVMFCCVIIGF